MSTDYLTTVQLPSRALLYNENYNIPAEITLRSMKTTEEKLIYGSTSQTVLDKILKACIVEPSDLNLDYLLIPDKHFLLIKLRVHTFGSKYTFSFRCPTCDEVMQYTVDLDDFYVHTLEEDIEEPFEIKLPRSGKTVGLRLLRGGDIEKIHKKAKRLSKKLNISYGEIEYITRLGEYIVSVDGEDLKDHNRQKFVEDLDSLDSAAIWTAIDSIRIGYDTDLDLDCKACGAPIETTLPMAAEFFRPRVEGIRFGGGTTE